MRRVMTRTATAESSAVFYESKMPLLPRHVHPRAGTRPARAMRAFRSPCPINATRNCVECHMPKVWYPEVHTRFTDHYIRVQIRLKDGG